MARKGSEREQACPAADGAWHGPPVENGASVRARGLYRVRSAPAWGPSRQRTVLIAGQEPRSRIGWIEQLKVQSNATIDLSASGFFEAHQRRAFPLSGARLLTM